ncbi:hypothetical protein [Nocardia sp. NPDC003726]
MSNGVRILATDGGVLVTSTDHRVLSFLDVADPDHLDLAIDPPTTPRTDPHPLSPTALCR